YSLEINIPAEYFNSFSGHLGVLVIKNSRILMNYNKILVFRYSPPQEESVFKQISGYVNHNFSMSIKEK
ncbi:MAG TPA: hypothetical protein VJ946_03965, partial [Bacteroidales bacterium]|nr:hypothetical protein [Bacteroidales bacterium]